MDFKITSGNLLLAFIGFYHYSRRLYLLHMKMSSQFLLALVILLLPLSAAVSLNNNESAKVLDIAEGPMKDALTAFNEGRHIKAVDLARPLAEKGNADAMYLLGAAHESGRGVELSRDKALEYFRKASEAGQKDATYSLARILLSSKDKVDRDKGLKNLEEQALKDPSNAGRILGEAYIKGMITEKPDFAKAVSWWNTASEAGDIPSILALARLYESGEPFADKKDPKKSLELYQKAIVLGDKSAIVAVGSRLLNGAEGVRNEKEGRAMLAKAIEEKQIEAYLALGDFEENIKEDPKSALVQYELGGNAKQIDCALRAADLYFKGKSEKGGKELIEKSETKGMEWLQKAAAIGHPMGSYRFAAKLLEATDPDNRKPEEKVAAARKAYDHLLNAAMGNIPQAQNEMALFYLSGAMGIADPSAAAGWFQRAAQSGNLIAINNLATLYEKGYGVVQNYSQAGQLYETAARNGSAQAATSVARLLASGAGTKPNIPQAWAWANIAIQDGDKDAKTILGEISTIATTKDVEDGKKALETLREELAKNATAKGTGAKTETPVDAEKKEGEENSPDKSSKPGANNDTSKEKPAESPKQK